MPKYAPGSCSKIQVKYRPQIRFLLFSTRVRSVYFDSANVSMARRSRFVITFILKTAYTFTVRVSCLISIIYVCSRCFNTFASVVFEGYVHGLAFAIILKCMFYSTWMDVKTDKKIGESFCQRKDTKKKADNGTHVISEERQASVRFNVYMQRRRDINRV